MLTPIARSSSLSRSNWRSNAESLEPRYASTISRSSRLVRKRRVLSRAMSRLTNRSDFLADMPVRLLDAPRVNVVPPRSAQGSCDEHFSGFV